MEAQYIRRHHRHKPRESQCTSALVKHIKAPVDLVWSLVRRFDQPQKYKPFVSRCIVEGDPKIGSLREVNVKSGLPATTSTERLELLDDREHILGIRIVGGDHRLKHLNPEEICCTSCLCNFKLFVADISSWKMIRSCSLTSFTQLCFRTHSSSVLGRSLHRILAIL